MNSLRQQLLWPLLAGVVVSGLAGSGIVYTQMFDEVNELCDSQLRSIAAAVGGESLPSIRQEHDDPDLDDDFTIQVWAGAQLLYHSGSDIAPSPRGAAGDPGAPAAAIETLASPQGSWRSFTRQDHDRRIQVAQPVSARRELALAMSARSLIYLLVMLPLLGVFIWILVSRRLAPLHRLGEALQSRGEQRLDPLDIPEMPSELRPTLDSLNDLLARLGAALQTQRAFVADAAHALRTPLAVVRLQAQEAEHAQVPAERALALTALRGGVDRATHLVQQLLILARLEPGATPTLDARSPVAVDQVAREAVADHYALAQQHGLDLGYVDVGGAVVVLGEATALRTLLDVLIDNAIRYVPAPGRIDVRAGSDASAVVLEVTDTGPGIAPHERARVLDRFYRGAAGSAADAASGNGLGLSIASAIAQRHAGDLCLKSGSGGKGLAARLRLPHAPGAIPQEPGP